MSSVNITIRVEEETKKQFDAFCESVGMNVTTAIHLFIKTVLRTRKIPFIISDTNELSMNTMFATERAKTALASMQKTASANGLSELSMSEINAEIAAYRSEKEDANDKNRA